MAFDREMFADKLQRYCDQFGVTRETLTNGTGISLNRIEELLQKKTDPTGDEVLIISDFFKCDFKFFISNEPLAPFEQTEKLFRSHGESLSNKDKWAIQEFLFLCESQEYLLSNTTEAQLRKIFSFTKIGTLFKRHGKEAAAGLRKHLGYSSNQVSMDIYKDFRAIGIHVFRRKLYQSDISGLFVRHPVAGPCILVNYNEDIFRQRFTAAHEVAHAILDDGEDFVVSFSEWDREDLSEIRANTFASHFLMPPNFLNNIPDSTNWTEEKVLDWAIKMKVNIEPMLYALKGQNLISDEQVNQYSNLTIPRNLKIDPELPEDLASGSRTRKSGLLQRGLSDFYVGLCFNAYDQDKISAGRLAEMLLCDDSEISGIAKLYGRSLAYVD
jgi:Zn-dependent peptidase ImmA (M78 family)